LPGAALLAAPRDAPDGYVPRMLQQPVKPFFFEKKNQKTFARLKVHPGAK
jgi:hypothetical protein